MQIVNIRRWLVGLGVALSVGAAVGISAARALVVSGPIEAATQELAMPALDRMVERLAAEARAGDAVRISVSIP